MIKKVYITNIKELNTQLGYGKKIYDDNAPCKGFYQLINKVLYFIPHKSDEIYAFPTIHLNTNNNNLYVKE